MNPSIAALLELQAIDSRRVTLRRARDGRRTRIEAARAAVTAAEAASAALVAEIGKVDALQRQYQADLARCDQVINDARSKQQGAKTNKEYMAIINDIEQSKSEKTHRETSLKELTARIDGLKAKVEAADAKVAAAKAALTKAEGETGADVPTPEEASAQADYDERKKRVDPDFLEQYERLVKANHKSPLLKVDPKTRATVMGTVISQNLCEQIRMGKLVIDRMSNAILYLPE
jgi:predicted  nucleic acid-binding Zn-ribbon protein